MVYLDFPERASNKQWRSGKRGSTSDTLLLPPPLNPASWRSGASSLSPSPEQSVETQREHKPTRSRTLVYLPDVVSASSLQALRSLSLAVILQQSRALFETWACQWGTHGSFGHCFKLAWWCGYCLSSSSMSRFKEFSPELHAGLGRQGRACVPASCVSKWEESLSLMVALGRGHGDIFFAASCAGTGDATCHGGCVTTPACVTSSCLPSHWKKSLSSFRQSEVVAVKRFVSAHTLCPCV